MKNDFINLIKHMKNNHINYEEKAYNEIINNLLIKKLKGQQKLTDLDSYDSEKNMPSLLIPGNIYVMQYIANADTKYITPDNNILNYSDKEPLILILSTNNNIITGINLNLCTYDLKTIILNIFYNIDPDFFEIKAEQMALSNKTVISQKIQALLKTNNITEILQQLFKQLYKINSYKIIFRNYNIQNIKNLHLIEPWQWKYIPFLNYTGTIKKDVLDTIHKITGISTIHI